MFDRFRFNGLVREAGGRSQRVSSFELFFDLVYVFAVTQLSHFLLEHLSLHGALQALLMLLAVWWVWVYTAWLTNWFDPNQRPVRITLIAVMLASLVMSATLPDAFGDRGLTFAATYAAIQVGRTIFAIAASDDNFAVRRNFQRILVWSAGAGALWLAGGFAHGSDRELLWLSAVIVEYASPIIGFASPGLGRSTTRDWHISGHHLAERCQLFLIVALGESIIITGATFADIDKSVAVIAALASSFLASVAFWWIYFDRGADLGDEVISSASDPGRLARSAYTYLHLPMVAGIIVAAVGDELVIAHPTGDTKMTLITTVVGGPILFLTGHLLFKKAVFNRISYSRVTAIVGLIVLGLIGESLSPITVSILAAASLVAVIAQDVRHYNQAAATRELQQLLEQPEDSDEFALQL